MKKISQLLIAFVLMTAACANDGIFELVFEDSPNAKPDQGAVQVQMPIKPRDKTVLGQIYLSKEQDKPKNEDIFTISVEVDEYEGDEFTPVLIDGDRALIGSFKLGAPTPSFMEFIFICKTEEEARQWVNFLQEYFKIDESKVKIDLEG